MSYPSKILLFGEHTVVRHSNALAIPYFDRFGSWEYSNTPSEELQQNLLEFTDYLSEQQLPLNIEALKASLKAGLFFQSNIPVGYGLGSSGALCAGIYDKFGMDKDLSTTTLKGILAKMESFFHGASSGTDPLVSYIKQPVFIEAGTNIKILNFEQVFAPADASFFLLDTGISRSSRPLVKWYLQQCDQDAFFAEKVHSSLSQSNNEAIRLLLAPDQELYPLFRQISQVQFDNLQRMIPSNFKEIWKEGLNSEHFLLKLCGAGGGGFILGLSKDKDKTTAHFKQDLFWLTL